MTKRIVLFILFSLILSGAGWGVERLGIMYNENPPPLYIEKGERIRLRDYHWPEDARRIANNFDLILIGNGDGIGGSTQILKQYNPEITVIVYCNMLAMWPYYENWDDFQDGWFLRDAVTSQKVKHRDGWYVPDISIPECRTYMVDMAVARVAFMEADGVHIDHANGDSGLANKIYYPEGYPDEVADISHFSSQFPDVGVLYFEELDDKLPDYLISINPDNTLAYDPYTDMVMMEGFVVKGWHPETYMLHWNDINNQVNRLKDLTNIGKQVLIHPSIRASSSNLSTTYLFWWAYGLADLYAPDNSYFSIREYP